MSGHSERFTIKDYDFPRKHNVEVFNFDEIAHRMDEEATGEHLSTVALSTRIKQYTLQRNEIIPFEQHYFTSQTVYVVEGMLGVKFIDLDEKIITVAVNAGEYFVIHDATRHQLENFADFPTQILSIYSGQGTENYLRKTTIMTGDQ